jgi:hypothetical protein
MIRIEAGSSIPYLGFHWDHSSSVKSVISKAELFKIGGIFSLTSISACDFVILLF